MRMTSPHGFLKNFLIYFYLISRRLGCCFDIVHCLFLSGEGCDSPCHPVGKLDNIIFCPRSLVIIGEITLQPEEKRQKSGFQLHSRIKKRTAAAVFRQKLKRRKKKRGVAFGVLDFLKSLFKEKEVITAIQDSFIYL